MLGAAAQSRDLGQCCLGPLPGPSPVCTPTRVPLKPSHIGGLPADVPAPHEINFAAWLPCPARCVCLSCRPSVWPRAVPGYQGTGSPGAAVTSRGKGAGAQGSRVVKAPPRLQLRSAACPMDRSAASMPARKAAPSPPHKCWRQGLAGPVMGVGSPETPGPPGEASASTVTCSLVWCPRNQQRAPTRHAGLRFLQARLGARGWGLPA